MNVVSQDFIADLFGDPFAVMNTIGLIAFAIVGSSKAVREEFDIFGILIVGIGGGESRNAPSSTNIQPIRKRQMDGRLISGFVKL